MPTSGIYRLWADGLGHRSLGKCGKSYRPFLRECNYIILQTISGVGEVTAPSVPFVDLG